MGSVSYAIISPVRNERNIIQNTLDSVINQNLKPKIWVIVDDGSTDGTYEFVKNYTQKYKWIKVVKKPSRGFDKLGGGVVEAFYFGLEQINLDDYDYIVKLDGDLKFNSSYFENLIKKCEENPKLGIVSGLTYYVSKSTGKLVKENAPRHHAIGASKIYRTSCFKDINGLIAELGWDSIDIIKARYRGWITRNYPEEILIHLRPMSSKGGILKGRFRNGLTDYITGYHPLFLLARGIYRMGHYPYFIGGIMIIAGYIYGYIKGTKQIITKEEKKYLHKQQLLRLIGIKPE
jgi:poly-beta-1,6-N-acetyl-D-glucosamine synthase